MEKRMQALYRRANALILELLSPRAKRSILERSRRPLPAAAIQLLSEMLLAARTPISRRRLRVLSSEKNLKIHLGCGADIRSGFINIDMGLAPWASVNTKPHPDAVVIRHDLRRGLPLADESCDFIYSSHFFEHLDYRDGLKLMRDCYRALRPGGTFRVSLPNFKGLFDAYLRADNDYVDLIDIYDVNPDLEPGTDTLVDHVNYGAYQNGEHKCIYDEEKLILILSRIGFTRVAESSYHEELDPADQVRRRYSFYLEAIK
jgi:SAM-dependent methyltransferase